MRITNRKLLKNWLSNEKTKNSAAEADLLKAVRISGSSLKKILYLEGYLPNEQTRLLLSNYTGLNEGELFPPIVSKEKEVV